MGVRSSIQQIKDANITLSDAQWVIAREYGFDSWVKLKHHADSMEHPTRILIVDGNVRYIKDELMERIKIRLSK